MKSLKNKAIDIKGKKYVLVADRIIYFNETYPNGMIQTELLESTDRVVFRAVVTPDIDKPDRIFNGYSQAVWGDGYINKTSALENAETSAVGRALAMMGIGVIDSVASVDEIKKAETNYDPSVEKAPYCDVCASEGIKAKTKTGRIFWTCPNWKNHQELGEKFKMIPAEREKTEAEERFINSLV
jgi:hypothetical protein